MKQPPPLTEPEAVPCLYVTGLGIEISDSVMRIVGWVHLPKMGGETDERRIVVRLAMSETTSEEFQQTLRRALTHGHH